MSPLLISFLAIIIITCASKILYKLLKSLKPTKQTTPGLLPPGPKGWPVIGSLPEMIKHRPTFRWIHKLMQENNTEIACIRLGQAYVIPVTSPELAREFLRKQDEIFMSRPECMSAKLTSSNFLTAILSPANDQWKKMRKIVASEVLSPAMHRFLHIKRCQEADHLVRYVYNQNGPVNVRVAARHYCGNLTRKLVFGKRFFGLGMEDGGPGKEEEEHIDSLFAILKFLNGFGIGDYFPCLEVFDFDGHKKVISDAIKSVRKYQDPEIVKRAKMWQERVKESEEDILDVLINLKDSKNNPLLTTEEIKAQIIEIMIAAVDNPSNAVEWAIAEMINQPHILDKAYKELDSVVGRGKLVQESDIPKLNYIKSCIKESFRLHPIAPFNVPHVSTRDTIVGGYFIPKGSHVLVSRPGLGRNPRVWDDHLKYKPERHIVDREKEVVLLDHELRVFSFGTGRRGCPGFVLGSTMATMLLARLVQGFSWTVDGPGFVELAESKDEMFMAKPLIAVAKPRLEPRIYQELVQSE
ncbi:hypothetical protein CASFOL_012807 [Castilleja foliolosa]|uniref:Cytochrome P450 n=1 Tax=Castilleja foliolosa TaxID=1961234 RepID=A0ABD3DJZ5_9LAMI